MILLPEKYNDIELLKEEKLFINSIISAIQSISIGWIMLLATSYSDVWYLVSVSNLFIISSLLNKSSPNFIKYSI